MTDDFRPQPTREFAAVASAVRQIAGGLDQFATAIEGIGLAVTYRQLPAASVLTEPTPNDEKPRGEWLTPAEVADLTGLHIDNVLKKLKSGEMHGHQRVHGGRWSVHIAAANAFVRGQDSRKACGCDVVRPLRRSR